MRLLPVVLVLSLFRNVFDEGFPNGYLGLLSFMERAFRPLTAPSIPVAVLICFGTFVLTLTLTWPIIQDLPIRTKSKWVLADSYAPPTLNRRQASRIRKTSNPTHRRET